MFGYKKIHEEIKCLREEQQHHNEMLFEFNRIAIDISRQLEFCNNLSSHLQKVETFAEIIDKNMKNLNKMIYEYKKAVDMERKLYKMEKEEKETKKTNVKLH